MSSLARWMIRLRLLLLAVCAAVTILAYPASTRVKHDHSLRSLFSPTDPRLANYRSIERDFGGDTTCVAVYADPELLTAKGMARLDAFCKNVEAVKGVADAISLAELPRPSKALRSRKLVDWFADERIDPSILRREVLGCELYVDQFVGSDAQTAAVIVTLERDALASGDIEQTLRSLRVIAKAGPYSASIVGTPVLISDTYEYLIQDSWVLANISLAAMTLVVLVLFRSVRWMVVPLLIVQAALIWTRALMSWSDLQLSIIGSMTTALITVVGIATAIHFAVRFREVSATGTDACSALRETLAEVGPAVSWTCLTTAAGFAALAISRVAPVRNFALVMATASVFVGIAAFLLVPGGVLLGVMRATPRRTPGEDKLAAALERIARVVERRCIVAPLAVLGLLAAAGTGFCWLQVETDFTKNFRSDSPILAGYRFVEDHLGGVGVIEVAFDAPERVSPEFLDDLRACGRELSGIDGVTKVTGLTNFLDFFDRAAPKLPDRLRPLYDRSVEVLDRVLPADSLPDPLQSLRPEQAALDVKLKLLQLFRPDVLDGVWNAQRNRMRLVLRVREQQTMLGKRRLLADIERITRERMGSSVTVSGLYVLLVFLIDSLLSDQWTAFCISGVAILLMASVAFRSLRLGLVALVPNLFPFIAVLGIMGWLDLRVNVATAMIGSISIGLVVDFSIHYLTRFQRERRLGADARTAVFRSHRSTGKAMVFANLALMLGFGVLTYSQFVPTVHFGLLVSVAVFGGLVGNLLLLPVLLRLAFWGQWTDNMQIEGA